MNCAVNTNSLSLKPWAWAFLWGLEKTTKAGAAHRPVSGKQTWTGHSLLQRVTKDFFVNWRIWAIRSTLLPNTLPLFHRAARKHPAELSPQMKKLLSASITGASADAPAGAAAGQLDQQDHAPYPVRRRYRSFRAPFHPLHHKRVRGFMALYYHYCALLRKTYRRKNSRRCYYLLRQLLKFDG